MFGKKEKQSFYKEKEFWLGILSIGIGAGLLFHMLTSHEEKRKNKWQKQFKRTKKAIGLKLLFD